MPTRAEKEKESSEWNFFFKKASSAAKIKAVTAQLEIIGFTVAQTGNRILEFSTSKPLKYDTAMSRLAKGLSKVSDMGKDWALRDRAETFGSTSATAGETEDVVMQSPLACERLRKHIADSIKIFMRRMRSHHVHAIACFLLLLPPPALLLLRLLAAGDAGSRNSSVGS